MAKIPIPDNPEFNTEMEAMDTNTPAYGPMFTEVFKQLLSNDMALKLSSNTLVDNKSGEKLKLGVEDGLLYIETQE